MSTPSSKALPSLLTRPLTPSRSNVHVLREQLERAEARARQAEEMLPEAADLQGRLGDAEEQLGRWRLILQGAAECATPEDVLHLLNTLQRQQMEARVQVGAQAARLGPAGCFEQRWGPATKPAT